LIKGTEVNVNIRNKECIASWIVLLGVGVGAGVDLFC